MAQEKSSASVPEVLGAESTDLTLIGSEPMRLIEQRNKAMESLLKYALSATLPEHWVNQGGNPYLTAAGAQAVGRRCAVKVDNVAWTREDHSDVGGSFYEYVYEGRFSLPGALDVLDGVSGSCTSRDSMIGTNNGARLDSDVDPGDIRKKAWTNMMQRGITALLGLRGMSWETLKKYGISPDGVSVVDYKAGGKGGGQKELLMPFGKQKGQPVSSLADKDLLYYLGAFQKTLADPAKERYHKATKEQIAAVEAEIESRKKGVETEAAKKENEAQGHGPAAGGEKPTMVARIRALAEDLGVPPDVVNGLVVKATGKLKGADISEEDFKKIADAFKAEVEKNKKDDIDFGDTAPK